jgi:alpha-D-xyloside xylohydrolase
MIRARSTALLVALLAAMSGAVAGCDDEETPAKLPSGIGGEAGNGGAGAAGGVSGDGAELALAAGTLVVDHEGLTLRKADGTAVSRLLASSFRFATVPELSPTHNYDPFQPYAKTALFREPDDLVVVAGTSLRVLARSAKELDLQVSFADGTELPLHAAVEGHGAVAFTLTLPVRAMDKPIVHVGLDVRGDATEGFYGLGESFDAVNQRGKVRPMQLEIDASIESSYNEAHVPVPFVIGTSGWGLFVASRRLGVFEVAVEEPDRVRAVFTRAFAPETEPFVFHWYVADAPLDLVKPYYETTGQPRLPGAFGLGPWIWRDEVKDEAEVLADLHAIRDLDLAGTGYWIDRPYATAVNTFDFEAARFPDVAKMFAEADALGFRTALWHTPYLDESEPSTAALRATAEAAGYYPLKAGASLNKWGKPLDLTTEPAQQFWREQLAAYTALGVRGFKLDYGEDIVAGLGTSRIAWSFHDGSDERTAQQTYTLAYHRTYAGLFPEGDSFLICRGGRWGDQGSVDVIWPGDLDATFAQHREPGTNADGSSYVSVGGLPASVIAGLSLGVSGFPFFGADTGGYRHSPPDKELFVRWFEQTALSTVMQVGTSSNTVPWDLAGGPGFDAEVLDLYRTYARLHLRLFPYLWSLAQRLPIDGRPIARPFGLAHPELGKHPDDQYLLGDALLVAPVVARGSTARSVIFPSSKWVDFFTRELRDGAADTTQTVAAPLERLPLFLGEGAIVPLLRETIDTLLPTTDPGIDSFATTKGPLHVRIVPGKASSFALFDGGTLAQAVDSSGDLTITSDAGTAFDGTTIFEVSWLQPAATSFVVTIDGVLATPVPEVAETSAPGSYAVVAGDLAAGLASLVRVVTGPGDHLVRVRQEN